MIERILSSTFLQLFLSTKTPKASSLVDHHCANSWAISINGTLPTIALVQFKIPTELNLFTSLCNETMPSTL